MTIVIISLMYIEVLGTTCFLSISKYCVQYSSYLLVSSRD